MRHRTVKEQAKQSREALMEMPGFPGNVVCGETVVSLMGDKKIWIENYRSILIYTDTQIRIQTRTHKLSIFGKNLSIRYYDKDEMEIVGHVEGVSFE